ncbi:glycosyltransferase family 4 protein [soil metagenome]
MSQLRVGILAGARFPIREPYAGGMEAHTHALARQLMALGHDIMLFASDGPDDVPTVPLQPALSLSDAARRDVSMPPERFIAEHHAYLHLLLQLGAHDLDVLHNNSLHYLPVAMAPMLNVPVVSTLHSPPTPWLESAYAAAATMTARPRTVSVSQRNARLWRSTVAVDRVIHNGVDTDLWSPRDGRRTGLVWSGRIVPEKGVHLAIAAARLLDASLTIAGPVHDRAYFDQVVQPALGARVRYAGHLSAEELARTVSSAEVALVTPQWEEPYGLVVAESLACGTPVAAIGRGAIPELLTTETGCVASTGSAPALAAATIAARALDGNACREWALRAASARVMAERYVDFYEQALAEHALAA